MTMGTENWLGGGEEPAEALDTSDTVVPSPHSQNTELGSGLDNDAKTKRVRGKPARAAADDDDSAPIESSGKPRHGVKQRKGLRAAVIAVLAVVLVVGGGVVWIWSDLNSKLNKVGIDHILDTTRPPSSTPTASVKYPGDPFAGKPVNVLVLGTDSREGGNQTVAGDDPGGVRSDTTFIAHISADRQRAYVVSIPRDTWITIPKCLAEDGSIIPEAGWMHMGFNAAFAYGYDSGGGIATGAACAIRAVEAMSDVRIDAYMVVDFQGFIEVVDALGGLDVTLLCAVKSSAARINLPKGVVHLDGKAAIGLARARKGTGLGDGSDLQRIRRQHALFSAIAAKTVSLNYITDFPKLYQLVGAVMSSITTDLGSDVTAVAGFAYSLKDLDMDNVTFITIPIGDAGNGVNVVILDYLAQPVWTALREDTPLPDSVVTKSPNPTASATTTTTTPKAPVIQSPSDCN